MNLADTRQALLQAVIDAPDLDAPRLVYADFLEEHGAPGEQDRAEFIRVQVALANWKGQDAEHCPVCGEHWKWRVGAGRDEWNDCKNGHRWCRETRRDLQRRLEAVWYAPRRGFADCIPDNWTATIGDVSPHVDLPLAVVRRGFAHTVRCPLGQWRAYMAWMVQNHPLARVELSDKQPVALSSGQPDDVWAGCFAWGNESLTFPGGDGEPPFEGDLPPDLFKRLKGRRHKQNPYTVYYTCLKDALADCSDALLAMARA